MFIENLNHNCEKSMWILDQKCSEVKGALRRRRRCLSRPPTFGGWRHGEGCLLPAAQKSDRRTFSTISGNSWDLPIHLLKGFGIFSNDFFSGISSSNSGLTRLVALYQFCLPHTDLSVVLPNQTTSQRGVSFSSSLGEKHNFLSLYQYWWGV